MAAETLPKLEAGEYPGGIWYYEPHTYQPYRYVLGRVGKHQIGRASVGKECVLRCRSRWSPYH